jgi:hypothetical protein
MLINYFPSQSPYAVALVTQSDPSSSNSFCEEAARVSQELDRECAQHSEQALAAAGSVAPPVPPVARRDNQFRSASAQTFFPVRSVFPRKLSPRADEDDPFLS